MQAVDERHDFPGAEERILQLWERLDAFKTSVERSKKEGRPEVRLHFSGEYHFGGECIRSSQGAVCYFLQALSEASASSFVSYSDYYLNPMR